MFTLQFWRAAGERAAKTGAQFVLAVLGMAWTTAGLGDPTAETLNAFSWNYLTIAGAFAAGVFLSLMFSLVSAKVTDGNPSVGDAEILTPTPAQRLGSPPPEPRPGDEDKFGGAN